MAARRHKDMKRVREKQITRTKVFSEEFFGVFFGMDFSGEIFREGFFGDSFIRRGRYSEDCCLQTVKRGSRTELISHSGLRYLSRNKQYGHPARKLLSGDAISQYVYRNM